MKDNSMLAVNLLAKNKQSYHAATEDVTTGIEFNLLTDNKLNLIK